jgi:hypothetical protein
MNIPTDVLWEVLILAGGIVIGKIWQHEGKLNKRVTFEDCSAKRKDCPCSAKLEKLENTINKLHPRNGETK